MEQAARQDPHGVCGARTRTGEACRKSAGWGTDHRGTGRCRLHGGSSPVKHGLYSTVMRGRAAELYELAKQERTDDPTDAIHALLAMWAAACEEYQKAAERGDDEANALAEKAARLGVELAKLMQGEAKRELAVPIDAVRDYVQRIADFVVTFIADKEDQLRCRRGIIGIPLVSD